MSEWWTYGLADFLLFSPRTYYRLFELYNVAIWPGQILALAIGIVIAAMLGGVARWRGRIVATLLAGCWLWIAWAYFLKHYATINWAASYAAAAFALEALLLIATGAVGGRIDRQPEASPTLRLGQGLFLFDLLVQPLIGPLVGRSWTAVELFGAAPDPTAVGTLGALLAGARIPWELLVIPALWCLVTGATLWAMEAPDAWVTPLALLLALGGIGWRAAARPSSRPMEPSSRR